MTKHATTRLGKISRWALVVFIILLALIMVIRHQGGKEYPDPETLIREPRVPAVVERKNANDVLIRCSNTIDRIRIYAGRDTRIGGNSIEHTFQVTFANAKSALIQGVKPLSQYLFLIEWNTQTVKKERYVVAERTLPLESVGNFRDIGGYPTSDGKYTRWGRIYRSANLSTLSKNDAAFLTALNIQTVLDLRTSKEIEDAPDHLSKPINYIMHSIYGHSEEPGGLFTVLSRYNLEEKWLKFYKETLIDRHAAEYGKLLRFIAEQPEGPLVIHCTSGKDRVGIATALLLLALDVPEDIVIADYTLSNKYYSDVLKHAEQRLGKYFFLKVMNVHARDLYPFFVANPEILQSTLSYIKERYGSYKNYLHHQAGLDDEVIRRLKDKLTE